MITKNEAEYIFDCLAHKTKTYKTLAQEFGVNYTTLCRWMKGFKSEFGVREQEKYSASTYLRYKHKEEIIQAYLSGESTKQIAAKYGFSDDHMIAELLRSFGIAVRGPGYMSRTDQTLFSSINSEEIAYTLGLITADGSVDDKYMIAIFLQESDKILLEEINKRIFNGTGTIIPTHGCLRLSICGKQICENLSRYDVVPNKTYTLTKIQKFSEPIMKHYLRGLFDGDGVCASNNPYLRVGYCGYNRSFVEEYQNYLSDLLGLNKNKLFNTGNCWDCSWGAKKDIEKIYHYFYDDATIFLPLFF